MSIFSVVSPATKVAGPAMLVSLTLAALPMTVFAVLYAFLGSADPRSGASYHWPSRYVHPFAGFMVCWLRILGSIGALYLMASIFADYLDQLTDVPRVPVIVTVLTLVFLVNLFGIALVGRLAVVLTAIKLIVFVTFILVGAVHIEPANFTPFSPGGIAGILAALPLLVGLFSGIESATEAGEEIRDSRRTIVRGLAVATIISVVIYFGTSIVSVGVLGPQAVAESRAPLADAAAMFAGGWALPALVVTALVSILAAINALFLIFVRFLFAMGRDGALSPLLAKVHTRWGTPWVASLAAFACGLVGMTLPDGLVFLFLAANLPTILKYAANCLAAIKLVEEHPDVHRQAAFQLRKAVVKRWAWLGLACAGVILLAGIEADWRAYALLVAWGVLGMLYWHFVGRARCAAVGEHRSA